MEIKLPTQTASFFFCWIFLNHQKLKKNTLQGVFHASFCRCFFPFVLGEGAPASTVEFFLDTLDLSPTQDAIVTTRIVTFLVGNPEVNLYLMLLLGGGDDTMDTFVGDGGVCS